ncbi:TFIIB-type zinc ribbon-containing protein [Dactylosporangium sp. NBC_01737]|uniref:TFIIB-type zinc ribbon-containing protein n=1 Tax=Dactylosporangium sp. NBC_01737 TaxID=2975959 RepID=UPI002E0FDDE9|nr:TFIIB-type zinc ribbon-containing protein [Dactylosporangium sp. NBC_01737]
MGQPRRYRYVGPADLLEQVPAVDAVTVDTPEALHRWLAGRDRRDLAEPVTFVVAPDGLLRLAPRRSEHVTLAGGQDVLAAGEMAFAGGRVAEVTNQSTGYCPDPDCWPAVAAALDRAGVPHPGGFTDRVVFRRCPACGERNVVRDGDFTCALCGGRLPARWNF